MANRKQHSDQLDLLVWAASRAPTVAVVCSELAAFEAEAFLPLGLVIDARNQFQQRTSDFIKSLIFGYSYPDTFEAKIINIADYRHSETTEAFVLVKRIAHG